MFEKILQRLISQRAAINASTGQTSNVSDRTLNDLAKSLVPYITTDEQLAAADFTASIKSVDGNISHVTANSLKKIKDDAKAEEARIAKEKAEEEARKAGGGSEPTTQQVIAAVVAEAMKPVLSEISGLKKEKIGDTRKAQLDAILNKAPDFYKTPILSGFTQMNFENDEAFTNYLNTVKTSTESYIQTAKEKGLPFTTPDAVPPKPKEDTGETKTLSEARKLVAESKEKKE